MVLGMAAKLEAGIDAQLNSMEDEDTSIEALRKRRLQQMQKDAKMKKELLAIGHGKYEEIADEKEFFAAAKKASSWCATSTAMRHGAVRSWISTSRRWLLSAGRHDSSKLTRS